jgi:hypothetical protein
MYHPPQVASSHAQENTPLNTDPSAIGPTTADMLPPTEVAFFPPGRLP